MPEGPGNANRGSTSSQGKVVPRRFLEAVLPPEFVRRVVRVSVLPEIVGHQPRGKARHASDEEVPFSGPLFSSSSAPSSNGREDSSQTPHAGRRKLAREVPVPDNSAVVKCCVCSDESSTYENPHNGNIVLDPRWLCVYKANREQHYQSLYFAARSLFKQRFALTEKEPGYFCDVCSNALIFHALTLDFETDVEIYALAVFKDCSPLQELLGKYPKIMAAWEWVCYYEFQAIIRCANHAREILDSTETQEYFSSLFAVRLTEIINSAKELGRLVLEAWTDVALLSSLEMLKIKRTLSCNLAKRTPTWTKQINVRKMFVGRCWIIMNGDRSRKNSNEFSTCVFDIDRSNTCYLCYVCLVVSFDEQTFSW